MKKWEIALLCVFAPGFALGALFSPGSALVLVVIGIPVAVAAYRRHVPLALVLPIVFAVIVAPFALFVASGKGTHMSPLLLYPFASPWALIPFSEYPPGFELRLLLTGCAINTVLVGVAGFLIDRRRAHHDEHRPA